MVAKPKGLWQVDGGARLLKRRRGNEGIKKAKKTEGGEEKKREGEKK
jgi:hypothetical protein